MDILSDIDTSNVTPNPLYVSVLAGQLRTLLAGLATLGIYTGSVSDETLTTVASAAVLVVMAAWSWYSKIKANRHKTEAAVASAHASANATAQTGTPTAVAVVPK
jgi:hypothetical protein